MITGFQCFFTAKHANSISHFLLRINPYHFSQISDFHSLTSKNTKWVEPFVFVIHTTLLFHHALVSMTDEALDFRYYFPFSGPCNTHVTYEILTTLNEFLVDAVALLMNARVAFMAVNNRVKIVKI